MTNVHRLIKVKLDQILKFRNTAPRTHLVCGIACANISEGKRFRDGLRSNSGLQEAIVSPKSRTAIINSDFADAAMNVQASVEEGIADLSDSLTEPLPPQ